ncbi:hypothetical protein NQ318_005455 [Aromia moschata]|uniref:peptidylprolyl isomerase n=1 Tax=Aromia moschata TaxID=1265417 RepID=A0AAV8YYU8_9CUCU|nr:hypothetical protein NQ318_005455 [Aromia moschata]
MSAAFIDDEVATEMHNASETVTKNDETEELTDGVEENEAEVSIGSEGDAKNKEEWVDLLGSGAIMKKILVEGKPDTRPQRSEKCAINYNCLLEDGTEVDSATNFELYLGESDVVQGLDLSIGLMNISEKCRLKIEPRLAFGKKGFPPNIPSDTLVIYDVELVSVEPEEEIESLSLHQRKIIGNKKRERGNWWYIRGENNIAIQCYRRALDYLDEVEGGVTGALSEGSGDKEVSDADLQGLLEDRISVCNNMAAAQIKMEMYDAALNSLQIVLRCQPNNVKAHFRKGRVNIQAASISEKNDLPTAMKCLQRAKELSPTDVEIQKEINMVAKLLEKQKVSERELARRMFNGPKKVDKINKGDVEKNKVNTGCPLGLWATIGATVAVGVAGIVAYRFKYA